MIVDVSVDAHAWVSAMEISMEAFFLKKKARYRFSIWSWNIILSHMPKIFSFLETFVLLYFIHNGKKRKTLQILIIWWTDTEKNGTFTYGDLLLR